MNKNLNKLTWILTGILGLGLTTTIVAEQDDSETLRAQGGTGFRINELRTFEPSQSTLFYEDGQPISSSRAQGGTGFKIRYFASEADNNATEGKLDEIELINVLRGPLVSINPLKVFDINALVTGQTYIADGVQATDFQLGDEVKVSGFFDRDSFLIITRIERVVDMSDWMLTGYVQNLTENQFNINGQTVEFNAGMVTNCLGPLTENNLVKVDAGVQLGFSAGDNLTTTQSVQCVDDVLIPSAEEDRVIVEGFIADVMVDGDFILASQFVNVTPSTKYIRGRAQDVQPLIKVEVEGEADVIDGAITASKVRFLEPRINLTLPVEPADFVGNQFHVAGVTLNVTSQVDDPDLIIANGLTQTTRIRFRGYDYGQGELFISRLNQQGNVSYDEVDVSGEVTGINQPVLSIFGVNVDTTGASFEDLGGQPISAAGFFALVEIGAEVEVEEATLDPVTDQISGGQIRIEELPETNGNQDMKGNDNVVIGLGTLTGTPDVIFLGSFEVP